MALATLSVDLVAKMATFERDLGRAARVAEQNAERVQAAMLRLGAGVAGALGGITVGSIVSLVRAQVDAIDGFNDLKDATGASIENISALDSLARRTGVSFDTVGTSLVKFNGALKEANDPSKGAGAVFKALGLDVEKLKQLDPAEALRVTAVALAGFADDGNKARAVQELFGKSLREVAPLLKDLGEQNELTAKTTTKQAEEAEKFNKSLYEMQANSTDAARALAGPLVSALNDLIQRFKDAKREGAGFAEMAGMIAQFATPGGLAGYAAKNLLGLGGSSKNGYTDARTGIDTIERALADPTLSPSERAALIGQQTRYRQTLESYLTSTAGAGRGTGGYSFTLPSLSLPGAPPKPAASGPMGPDLAAQGLALAQSLTAQDAGLTGDFFGKWEKLTAAYKGNKITLDELTEAQALLLKQQPFMRSGMQEVGDTSDALTRKLDAQARATERIAELNAEIDRLSGRTGDDRKRQLTEALETRINAGEIFSPEELKKITLGIAGLDENALKAVESANEMGDAFTNAFEAAILRGEDLGQVLKNLGMQILTMAVNKSITGPIGAALGTYFSGLFGFASGGVMTSAGPIPLRAYAAGGVANTPQLAMFGEGSMAEAYVPLPDGRRIPVAMKGGGGRPINIVQHLTVGDVASMTAVDAKLKESERRMVAGLDRAQRYGRA